MFQGSNLPHRGCSGGRNPGGVGTQKSGPTGIVPVNGASAPSVSARATSSSPTRRPSANPRPSDKLAVSCSALVASPWKRPLSSRKKYASTVEAAPSTAASIEAAGLARATARCMATLRVARTREACGGSAR